MNGSILTNFFTKKSDKVIEKPKNKAIIIHVHGGGFVSMSSGSH
jgi:acetyl esterase/lipase